MIYFPWDRTGTLLKDQHDFDHRPHENMVRYAEEFDVVLWTYDKAEDFCRSHYPDIGRLMHTLAHPTMRVDVLRWLVVWHFGGIYWQYDMNPLAPMDRMLPSKGKEAKVFTEFVADSKHCRKMAAEPIRRGEPEEPVRILNQCFSAIPRQQFIRKVLDLILERSRTLVPKKDYDILYICANAAVSTVYDQFGKHDAMVERVSRADTRSLMQIEYKGTWRKEKRATGPRAPGMGHRARERAKRVLRAFPGLEAGFYRYVRPHAHEKGLQVAASPRSGKRPLGGGAADVAGASCLVLRASLGGRLRELGIRSVLECTPGGISVYGEERVPGINWYVTSPVRHSPNLNPNRTDHDYDYERSIPASQVSFINPMYSRLPRVDAMVLVDYLDQIPNADVLRIVDRARRAGIRWLVATHYPNLNANWDTYVGEWRPINLVRPPFNRPEPAFVVPDPDPERRPDRVLAAWLLSG